MILVEEILLVLISLSSIGIKSVFWSMIELESCLVFIYVRAFPSASAFLFAYTHILLSFCSLIGGRDLMLD